MRLILPDKLFGRILHPLVHPNHARMSALWNPSLPPPPEKFDVDTAIGLPFPPRTYKNDVDGDCVIAARANQSTRFLAAQLGYVPVISDDEVEAEYFNQTGGADAGLVPDDSLALWQSKGWTCAGAHHSAQAWGRIDATDKTDVRRCISLLTGMQLSLELPTIWRTALAKGEAWDAPTDPTDPDAAPGSFGGHQCFSGDTKIPLLDGTERTLAELSQTHADGHFWVYSCRPDGNIVPGRAFAPRKIGVRSAVKVTLDNGEKIRCTADHRFMMRDGTYKEAGSLALGDSLMPLYRRLSTEKGMSGYEQTYNPKNKKWYFTHRLVHWNLRGWYRGVLHHEDFNKNNNSPGNLRPMSHEAHIKLHAGLSNPKQLLSYAKSDAGRAKSREMMKLLWADPDFRAKQTELKKAAIAGKSSRMADGVRKYHSVKHPVTERRLAANRRNAMAPRCPEVLARVMAERAERLRSDPIFRERMAQISKRNISNAHGLPVTEKQRNARRENIKVAHSARMAKTANNHKVVCVEDDGICEVYDLSVEKYHNFALSAGVFVHNCWAPKYDESGIYVWTWGQLQLITWAGLAYYGATSRMGEAEAVVRCPDAVTGTDPADHMDIAQLLADLKFIASAA